MLKYFFGDMPEAIYVTATYFNHVYQDRWITDPLTVEMIKDVDRSVVSHMRLLFCNIAWMNYYKGILPGVDEPYGGGSYVLENKDAHEKYNFDPVRVCFEDGEEQDVCFGFTETKTARSGKKQDLHIEKIEGWLIDSGR